MCPLTSTVLFSGASRVFAVARFLLAEPGPRLTVEVRLSVALNVRLGTSFSGELSPKWAVVFLCCFLVFRSPYRLFFFLATLVVGALAVEHTMETKRSRNGERIRRVVLAYESQSHVAALLVIAPAARLVDRALRNGALHPRLCPRTSRGRESRWRTREETQILMPLLQPPLQNNYTLQCNERSGIHSASQTP